MIPERGPHLQVETAMRRHVPGTVLRQLRTRMRRAGYAMGLDRTRLGELNLQICGPRRVAQLNLDYRGQRGSTDVLSFPGPEHDGRGDLALDWTLVQRQAEAGGRSALDEATVLVVHGMAHLLGHDHATRAEGRRMLRWERRALRALGLPDGPRPYGGES